MDITVYGCGYVGSAVSACLADAGIDVLCVENNPKRLRQMEAFSQADDSDLAKLVSGNRQAGRLRFTSKATQPAGIIFVCVGTPSAADGEVDLSAVYAVVDSIVAVVAQDTFIFIKSTVPPGTCARLQKRIDAATPRHRIEILSNPEFLREGSEIKDFITPDRVVVGVQSQAAESCAHAVYQRLHGHCDLLALTTLASAELAKYASNAMLATRLALMNEVAIISEKCGAEIDDVRKIVGMDSRIGDRFLVSSCGFGGPCLGKDLQALDHISATYLKSGLMQAVLAANRQHQLHALDHLSSFFQDGLAGLNGTLWGLTFKANTSDRRDAPAEVIIGALREAGVILRAYDPSIHSSKNSAPLDIDIPLAGSPLEAATGADFVVICTAWAEFAQIEPTALCKVMAQPMIVDACNVLQAEQFVRSGFHYRGMGRTPQSDNALDGLAVASQPGNASISKGSSPPQSPDSYFA